MTENQREFLNQLKHNPNNPRKITDQKLEFLLRSLKEHGPLDGFVYNIRSNQFVGGHQRSKSLPSDSKIVIEKRYDLPTSTATIATGFIESFGKRYPYREVDWSPNQEKIASIAANKNAGEWDYGALSEIMIELDQQNYDLSLSMFDHSEIERIVGGWDNHSEAVEKIEENLEGISKLIKIKCGEDQVQLLKEFLILKLNEAGYTGIEVIG